MNMKKCFYLLFAVFFLFTACSKDETPDKPVVDTYLVSASKSGEIQKAFFQLALTTYPGLSQYASLPQTDVSLIRMTYLTEYPKGEQTTASGVCIIPSNYDASFPTVVYTHGTITQPEAPSLSIASPSSYTIELLLSAAIASSFKCAVLVPDYIGYGESEAITHPFLHAESLGQASLDLIQAFREYAVKDEVALAFNNRLLISGYSEGGSAAVALQKTIQGLSGSGLTVEKVIAGSGAYDNVAQATEFMKKTTTLNPSFVSSYLWTFQMYKTDFAYAKNYNQIFSEEDNALLQSTQYNMAYFATEKLALHTNPSLLFRQDFREGVLNGTDTEFLRISKENSLVDFTPRDSLILVCGSADDWVYPINTRNAYNAMISKGCPVNMYEYPGGTHQSTMINYLEILLGRLSRINKMQPHG